MEIQLEWLFRGLKPLPPPEIDPNPIPYYCPQALDDAAIYTLVRLGHYSRRQLDDPDEIPWDFAVSLLRADKAWHAALAAQQRDNPPRE